MTITLHGLVANEAGYCRWDGDARLERRSNGALVATIDEPRSSFDGGGDYSDVHPRPIPIRVRHRGPVIGELCYLSRCAGRLSGVGVIHDADALDQLDVGEMFWSSTTRRTASGLQLTECSIVTEPARVGLPPLKAWPGDVTAAGWDPRRSRHDMIEAGTGLLIEARNTTKTHAHRYARELHVVDLDERRDGTDQPELVHTQRPPVTQLRAGQPIRLPDGSVAPLAFRPGRIIAVRER